MKLDSGKVFDVQQEPQFQSPYPVYPDGSDNYWMK